MNRRQRRGIGGTAGENLLTVRARDRVGNESTFGGIIHRAVAAEANPPETSPIVAFDSGLFPDDHITFVPTLVGTVSDESRITRLNLAGEGVELLPYLNEFGAFVLTREDLEHFSGEPFVRVCRPR